MGAAASAATVAAFMAVRGSRTVVTGFAVAACIEAMVSVAQQSGVVSVAQQSVVTA